MAAIIKTANTHQTSLLVSEQIPDFIRGDHPKFVVFIEKYYEFLAQANSGIATSDGLSHYYGADHATKVITDINDIDTTDLDKFIGSFQKQYGYGLPQRFSDAADTRILYKNLVNFYRSVGTEDSFKMLFRLLFNEEIEIYYPFQDVLIASGGNFTKESRIKVNYVENLNDIENTKIIGATSGAYGTVERVQVLPGGSDSFITGRIGNTSISYTSGVSNTDIYDPMKYLEHGGSTAFVYLTDQSGNFDFFEDIYVDDVDSTVSNTIVLPLIKKMLAFDGFLYGTVNNVISAYDGMAHYRANSTSPPWGSANIDYSNTGVWHTTGGGTGEIKLVSNVYGSYGGTVLEIGNNSTLASATGDQRHVVYAKNVGIGGEDRLYRMSIRARDLGGNSAVSVAEGNRFSAGISCVRHDLRKLSADDYKDQWEDPLWLVSHKQAIDDEFFVYTAYFKGRETRRNVGGSPYPAKNYGSGGRVDLTSGTRYYNSAQKAVDREVLLPFNTTFVKPTFKVNEPGDGATYSQGITQIDFISLEELTSIQTQIGKGSGSYSDERSLLSTTGAHIQDGNYWQIYAYDIRSKQQTKDYATVVREAVHPAGMKMFGTTISESSANGAIESADITLSDTFSPDSLDSLAGWWRADAIGPDNIQYKKYGPNITANGIYGTERNRFPVGLTSFEDLVDPYDFYESNIAETVVVGGSGDAYIGKRALKITDRHIDISPFFDFPTRDDSSFLFTSGDMANHDDYEYPVVVEPYKKWLLSFYGKVSNTTLNPSASATLRKTSSFYINTNLANTSGADPHSFGLTGLNAVGNTYPSAANSYFPGFDAENTWERKSMVIDLSSSPHTRLSWRFYLPARNDFVAATGNTTYHLDGFMLEEYDSATHGTIWGSHTPTPYLETGMNGGNVISWYDQSLNEHHVYANTHGGIFHTPQFIANAVGGKPAIRFSANTVKNTSNVYKYSSIGGTVNSIGLFSGEATNFKPPTSGLQSTKSLSSATLSNPVSNTWTIMAVAKTNLAINSTSYDTALNPTIFNSGYGGNKNSLDLGAGSITGTMHLGYDVIDETGAILTNVVNSTAGIISANSAAITDFGGTLSSANTETFRIIGVSINASSLSGSSVTDLLNFHIDGRRFANSEINNTLSDMSYTGMHGISQNAYVTSIGKWAPSNNKIWDTSATGVNNLYPYGAADWDGDITEIVVFNEKLSNTNIALVEGYLAHKYGLQENLIHKDGTTNETEVYRWEYTNTQNGWEFENSTAPIVSSTAGYVSDSPNTYISMTAAGGSSGNQIMKIALSTHINGSAYDKAAFRYKLIDVGTGTTANAYQFGWKNDDSSTLYQLTALGNAGVESGWTEKYFDMSGQSEWVGKNITYLQYIMNSATSGESVSYIDWVYVSGNNHPHPYRYNAPTAVGANNWNINY